MEIELTEPQSRMFELEAKFPLFVAGYGAGKTQSLIVNIFRDLLLFPGANIATYAPTFDIIGLNLIPRIIDVLENSGLSYTLNKSAATIMVDGYGRIIMRSMTNPGRIIAYEVFRSHIDEIDTISTKVAIDVWEKVVARNRQTIIKNDSEGNPVVVDGKTQYELNTISCYTTPDHGFNSFTYKYWGGDSREEAKKRENGYEYVQAPTSSNPHNPPDYVDTLRRIYPQKMVDAFVLGKWVNMSGMAIFDSGKFNRYTVLPRDITHGIVYGDTAQKTKEQNDYSVFQYWAYSPTMGVFLIDQIRGKWTAPQLKKKFSAFYKKHSSFDKRKTFNCRMAKIEDKASGTGLIQEIAESGNIPIEGMQRNTDKITRALDVLPQIDAGNVHIPDDVEWLSDYLKEFDEFNVDQNTHDDQIDPTMDAITDMLIANSFNYGSAI